MPKTDSVVSSIMTKGTSMKGSMNTMYQLGTNTATSNTPVAGFSLAVNF